VTQEASRKNNSTNTTTAGRKAWRTRILLVLGLFLFASGQAFADRSKRSRDLDRAAPGSTVRVIVQFKHAPTNRHHQKIRDKGGELRRALGLVKGGAYSLPASALEELSNDPEVAYISLDRRVRSHNDYAAATVGANVAWQLGLNGAGIGVAVVDSGVADHPDLHDPATGLSRVVYSESFVGDQTTADLYGHGTHVAGIIGGSGASSNGLISGIASGVNIISLRVLDQSGAGADSGIIAAIQRAIQLKDTYNIRVINLSVGRPVYESYSQDPLCQAAEAAWNAGIVVVAAAGNNGRNHSFGNSGYGTVTAPGNDPYVLTVGAMKTLDTPSPADDQIATFSSKGPTLVDHVVKPDIVAPGNRIVSLLVKGSTLDQEFPGNEVTSTGALAPAYFSLSGTSMATPVVSGAVALLLQSQPQLTPDQVKARLMKTAAKNYFPTSTSYVDPTTGTSFTSYYDIFTVGAGYLDVAAALASTDVATGSAASPAAVFDPTTGQVTLAMDSSIWGNSALWGASTVWGTSLSGTSVVGGTSTVWGTSTASDIDLGVLWGTSTAGDIDLSVLWGTSTAGDLDLGVLWGTSVLWSE